MTGPFRLARGGLVDRGRPVSFCFDERRLEGFAGDTVASALLAAGVRLAGRSFKYHRPRGVVGAGLEEPNALVTLGAGAFAEPNVAATVAELTDGLWASSQNAWPSLAFDALAVNQLAAAFIPAGFYYKTFMGPPGWRVFEPFIRRAAGLGAASRAPDPDRYEHVHAHCDVLVVGGGPAGLCAALAASEAGASVVLAEADFRFGGRLLAEREMVEGLPGAAWAEDAVRRLAANPRVRLLPRTTAYGYYEDNQLRLIEQVGEGGGVRQRLWRLRPGRVVIAAGALERPIPFANNDRPGVMLASAVRAYINRFGVAAAARTVIHAANDDGLQTARDLLHAGLAVAAIVDVRPDPGGAHAAAAEVLGVRHFAHHQIVRALGRGGVSGAEVAPVGGGAATRLACDSVAVSGGWSPTLHLHAQAGGGQVFEPALGALVPVEGDQPWRTIGAAAGRMALEDCLADGRWAGAWAAGGGAPRPPAAAAAAPSSPWPEPADAKRAFIDQQNDVTLADVRLAVREGYAGVEHLKRYTTLGMGTDQGKTSNLVGWEALARATGVGVETLRPVRSRPPYAPVSLGAMAGDARGGLFKPTRRTPMHAWHQAAGAVFTPAGLWQRPRYYPQAGEGLHEASLREAAAVRGGVGLVDVSTLGKIEVRGPDAAAFLDRIYVNRWLDAPVGKARYGVMLREDGLVFDDGTTTRLADDHFFMTTTTAGAARVLAHLEHYRDVVWPDLRVALTPVTERWAAMALAGPRSRNVLARMAGGLDVSNEALPHLGVRAARIAGAEGRIARVSFSGELAYEIYVPAPQGEAVWEALLAAGAPEAITPYGLEALAILRIEVGHLGDGEIDGRTTAADLGLGKFVSRRKAHVGARMAARPVLTEPARPALVGLIPVDGVTPLRAGAQLVEGASKRSPGLSIGRVSSPAFSPTLGHPVALGLVTDAAARHGQTLWAASPLHGEHVAVRLGASEFVSPRERSLHD